MQLMVGGDENEIWDHVWPLLSLLLKQLTELHAVITSSKLSAAAELRASERRAVCLEELVESCRAELSTVLVAIGELENLVGILSWRDQDSQQYRRSLEAFVLEVGKVLSVATAETAELAAEMEHRERTVSLRLKYASALINRVNRFIALWLSCMHKLAEKHHPSLKLSLGSGRMQMRF